MADSKNTPQRRGYVFLFKRYAVFLAVVPLPLVAIIPPIADLFEGFALIKLPITFYCTPAAILFGEKHFFMHAEVRPADFIGWISVFISWLAVSAIVAFFHAIDRDRNNSV